MDDATIQENSSAETLENQDGVLSELRTELGRPHHRQEDIESSADKLWSLYRQLNIVAKRTLTRRTSFQILRAVVHADSIIAIRPSINRRNILSGHKHEGTRWGNRMAQIIKDMCGTEPSDDLTPSQWHSLEYAVARLASVGDIRQVERISREMKRHRLMNRDTIQRVFGHRLTALSRRLRDVAAIPLRRGGIKKAYADDECLNVLWTLLREHQGEAVELSPLMVVHILTCVDSIQKQKLPHDAARALDGNLETILVNLFGVNLVNLSVSAQAPMRLTTVPLNALLGYLGRQGDLWRMVSAFEILTTRRDIQLPAVEAVIENVPTSLRSQLAEVPRNLYATFREMDPSALRMQPGLDPNYFRRAALAQRPQISEDDEDDDSVTNERCYNDFLPPSPMPLDIARGVLDDRFLLSDNPITPGDRSRDDRSSTAVPTNLIFSTMLRFAYDKRDLDVALYTLRSAHQAAVEAHGDWVRQVLATHGVSSMPAASRTSSSPETTSAHSENTTPSSEDGYLPLHGMFKDDDTHASEYGIDRSDIVHVDNSSNESLGDPRQPLEWFDKLEPPRAHFSFWQYDLVHWMHREKIKIMKRRRGLGSRFRAINDMMADSQERLRQEIKVLYGSDTEDADSSRIAPPFRGFPASREGRSDLSLRRAFDPTVYRYNIEQTERNIQELLEASNRQSAVVAERRRRSQSKRKERKPSGDLRPYAAE